MGEGNPRYTREECREKSPAPDLGPGPLRAGPVLAPAAILDRYGGRPERSVRLCATQPGRQEEREHPLARRSSLDPSWSPGISQDLEP